MPASQWQNWVPIGLALLIVAAVAAVILVLNRLLGPRRVTPIKEAPFESGEQPITSPRQRFSVEFYLVAIFFVVFDVEAVFLFPWAVEFRQWAGDPAMRWVAFGEMFVFLGVLALGLAYVWKRGGLKWE